MFLLETPPLKRKHLRKEGHKSRSSSTTSDTMSSPPVYAMVDKNRTRKPMLLPQESLEEDSAEVFLNYTQVVFTEPAPGPRVVNRKESQVVYSTVNVERSPVPPRKVSQSNSVKYENIQPKRDSNKNVEKVFSLVNADHTATESLDLAVKKGEIVMVEREEGSKSFCVRCAVNQSSKPEEGWVPSLVLSPYEGDYDEVTRYDIPIIKKDEVFEKEPTRPIKRGIKAIRQKTKSEDSSSEEEIASPSPGLAEETFESLSEIPAAPSMPSPSVQDCDIKRLLPADDDVLFTQVVAVAEHVSTSSNILSFGKGDVAYVLKTDPRGWWCVKIGKTTGWVPKDFWKLLPGKVVKREVPYEQEPWFAGKMERKQCEKMMEESAPDRSFLIRESVNRVGDFTLSVIFNKKVRHFPIESKADRTFYIGKHDFKTMTKIVKYYKLNPLFYDSTGEHISLGEPFKNITLLKVPKI